MTKGFLISTGTELLLGDTEDTNAGFLSRRLATMGVRVVGRATVGDNQEMIGKAIKAGLQSADLVITSGGLGPTSDDLTREAVSQVLGLQLELREDELERIREYFTRRRRKMPLVNEKQALFPTGALILKNPRGTAPGFVVSQNGKTVVCLPGPPREMEAMFEQELEVLLHSLIQGKERVRLAKTLLVMGPGESQVETLIQEIMDCPQGCGLALIAKDGEVHIRITCEDVGEKEAGRVLNTVVGQVKTRLGASVYGEDKQSLSEVVIKALAERGQTLALAESCSGGLVSKLLTDVPGSSRVFWGGVISYSNEAKQNILGVKSETLKRYGAVSPETAQEMAKGVRNLGHCSYGLSLTGIAGPDGGSKEKPVGLVYAGLASEQGTQVKELRFLGERDAIRMLAAKSVLDWLRRSLG